jgi:hypothetical protein
LSLSLFEPAGIHDVVIGNPFNLPFEQLRRKFFHTAGGHACVHATGFAYHIFLDDGASGDEAVFFHYRLVHDDGAHTHQYMVVYGTAMYQRAVANAHVVTDGGAAFLVGAVEDGPVLDINFIANADKVHIAAHHCLKPNGALVAHHDITDDGSIFGQETISAKLWSDIAAGENKWHVVCGMCFREVKVRILSVSQFLSTFAGDNFLWE